MTVKEVAEYLGFSATKIYRLVESGEIPRVKVGGQYRFPRAIIDDWLAGRLEYPVNKSTRSTRITGSTRRNGNEEIGEALRVEDVIVGHLLVFKTTNDAKERAAAAIAMRKALAVIDWQYMAAQAQTAGVLDEAIAVEKGLSG